MVESLREIILESPALYVSWLGLLLGIVFGYVVYKTNFCTMGSISDLVTFEDYRRFRSWLLAAATAILGAHLVQYLGFVDLGTTMYVTPNANWLANIVGGLMFGFGMVFGGGCVTKNLVRIGGGDMRSLIVVVFIGIFAFMTIGGLVGSARVALFSPTEIDLASRSIDSQTIGSIVSGLSGASEATTSLIAMFLVALALLFYCFKDKEFRSSRVHVFAGLFVGMCVVLGWMLTGLAFDEFNDPPLPVASLTFVRPAGDTLEYLMRFTAFGAPSFAVVTLVGTILGAFIAAKMSGRFIVTTFADNDDTKRNLFGAALMGIGGVLALGCTIGQALTGTSTLALGSLLTFAAIVVGGIVGVRTLNKILMGE